MNAANTTSIRLSRKIVQHRPDGLFVGGDPVLLFRGRELVPWQGRHRGDELIAIGIKNGLASETVADM
jgi:hypothetical protein